MTALIDAAKIAGTAIKTVGTAAAAHPFLTSAAVGAASSGVQAIGAAREAAAQRQAQNAAQQQAQQQAAFQAQALQAQSAQAETQSRLIAESVQARRDAFAALTKPAPVADTSPLKGLATIATSPLGDTSEPNIGRRKLLGN